MAAKADLFPEIQGISAASLDDPGAVELVAHIWTSSAQPWDFMDPALRKFETTPGAEELGELVRLARKA